MTQPTPTGAHRPDLGGMTVTVVGGSVIGLSCAWRAALAGADVTVCDPEGPAAGEPWAGAPSAAAWVAGGMLAAYAEAWPGEPELFALAAASLERWPAFLAELGHDEPVATASDTYLVGVDEADAGDLQRALDWAHTQSPGAESAAVRITRRDLRREEPSLARGLRVAYRIPGEGAVDNRRLLRALAGACDRHGVRFARRQVTGREELDRELTAADRIVLAAGNGSADFGLPVRPVKGEVLRLHARPGCEPPPRAVIRGLVRGRPVYLVPRDGGVVIGATQYEHGDDRRVTAAGVRDLLADAEALFPGIGEYELAEASAGLRPMSPDNVPVIGPVADDGRIIAATGHGRAGVTLAPVTADAVVDYLGGTEPPPVVRAARPDRFDTRPATGAGRNEER